MGWKEVPAKELREKAEVNDYKQGAHPAEDSIEDDTEHTKRTLENQIKTLRGVSGKIGSIPFNKRLTRLS